MIDLLKNDTLTQCGAVLIIGMAILAATAIIMLALDDKRIDMSSNELPDDPTQYDDI